MKWVQGKGTFRAEATRRERNKDNSAVERTGDFFQQLASPIVHVVNSTANSWTRVELEWDDFMHWCADPIHASSLPPYHWRVYLPHHTEQENGSKRCRSALRLLCSQRLQHNMGSTTETQPAGRKQRLARFIGHRRARYHSRAYTTARSVLTAAFKVFPFEA